MTLNVTKFAAIKGKQSGDDYFTVICEMGLIPKLFLFNEATIPTELRAQRHINKGRIPEMAKYIVDNPKNYIFLDRSWGPCRHSGTFRGSPGPVFYRF